MITLYVIKSNDKSFRYISITNDLTKRLRRHNNGRNKSTRPYAPFKLIHKEFFDDYESARKQEVFLKSGAGRTFLDNLN